MARDFREFVAETKSNSSVVVGAAPSLGTVENHINATSFWLGDAHRRTKTRTAKEIYVRANSEYPSLDNPEHLSEISGRGFTFLIAETVMESSKSVATLIEETGLQPAFVFDQKHFLGERCNPIRDCCKVLNQRNLDFEDRTTIQEFLATCFGVKHHYSSGDTVALHAFAFSLLIGSNQIYLTGIDLPFFQKDYIYPTETPGSKRSIRTKIKELVTRYKKYRPSLLSMMRYVVTGFFRKLKINRQKVSLFAEDFPSIFADFQYLVDLGIQNGAQIYYCSEQSNLRKLNGILKCPECLI